MADSLTPDSFMQLMELVQRMDIADQVSVLHGVALVLMRQSGVSLWISSDKGCLGAKPPFVTITAGLDECGDLVEAEYKTILEHYRKSKP